MARRQSRNNSSSRGRKPKKGSNTVFIVLGALCVLLIIGLVIWALCSGSNEHGRAALDKYVELTQTENLLDDGASVYVDMSNGMISAYASDQSKKDLQAIINKLAAERNIQFYGLASGNITELNLDHTKLYNFMLNPANYSQQQAPIEKTLAEIVTKNQPALLMSDFEEYNNGLIQKAAYAKRYFIDWLAKGYNITFYKWNYLENGKAKNMYFAVFDDNANRLNSLVENAVRTVDPEIETYVLGSREFAYPTAALYYYTDKSGNIKSLGVNQGGNYHNSEGKDIITAIMEKGGPEDYISYAKPFATSTGVPGQFAPLDHLLGTYAEYYPLGVSWKDAIEGSKLYSTDDVPLADRYSHFLSNLYVNFDAQNGYTIDDVEIRVFDVEDLIKFVGDNDSIDIDIKTPEINGVFIADTEIPNADLSLNGWKHIFVDFDEKFNGSFVGGIPSTNLLRANLVISKASPNLAEVDDFFLWPGNPSLSNSVRETLSANTSNPAGRILFTYYIKTLSE